MRSTLHARVVAALLAPVLLAAGGAQGLLFMRCGEQVRMSCCCPKEAPPSAATLDRAPLECCAKLAVPSAPERVYQPLVSRTIAPAQLAVLTPAPLDAPIFDRSFAAPRLDPPPGPSLVIAHRALLI